MQKIRPVGYHADFKYRCSVCGSEQWYTEEEAKVAGFRFLCCGEVHVLDTIQDVSLKLSFVQKPVAVKKDNGRDNAEVALKHLRGLGFVGTQYETLAIELSTEGHNVQEIIRQCIAL